MKLRSVRVMHALAGVALVSGGAVVALPATAAASEADSATTSAEASPQWDGTYYTDHPVKCEDARRDYSRWAWVSECYRFGLQTWAFDYTCRIC